MDRFDDEGGIAPWAIRALGFDEPCQCGHDWGHHQAPGTECVVLDCTCASFRAFTKPDDQKTT
jgi:hypothetical protein